MENNFCEKVHELEAGFERCQKLLTALGDENRQHLLCIMAEMPVDGSRVVDIAEKTHLSRPAVSHHMQILKEAGIVKSRKEGTLVYYYFDPDDTQVRRLAALVSDLVTVIGMLPDRESE